ncbi:MAG: hypothetical protein A2104_00845 [Candidatus Melainabacteria bacterium GWF2_32_7]|nr:MAG: hypothetical protein A2104_00845 [Candidatus Melainabacteria bacterium GWF2_32_7]
MIFSSNTRIKLGLTIIILAVFLSNIQLLVINLDFFNKKIEVYPNYPDRKQFIKYEQQFKTVRKELPLYGSVGYITDDKIRAFDRDARFFVAQYMLSPLVVVNSINYKYIIGNFYAPINPESYKKYNLVLIKDFGDGMMLFEREDK